MSGNRCASCSKMMPLDFDDPNLETTGKLVGEITATVRIARSCADCGNERRREVSRQFQKARASLLRERACELLCMSVDASNAGLWGETIRHATVKAALALADDAQKAEPFSQGLYGMTTKHQVHFPRFHDDIMSARRTLFHAPVDEQAWAVGDVLYLLAAPNFPRCIVAALIDVRSVRLCAEIDADLGKLGGVERAAYLARWDALHPEQPSINDPIVWRIEFRYGDRTDPPEWSLAA